MSHWKTLLIFIFLVGTGGTIGLFSQEAATCSGGDAVGAGGSAAYSIGQVAYVTLSGPGGVVSQGVEQAFEISSVGLAEPGIGVMLRVFPNPTTEKLMVLVEGRNCDSIQFELFDLNGRRLSSGTLNASQNEIQVSDFPAATYVLDIFNEFGKIQSFRVVKNY